MAFTIHDIPTPCVLIDRPRAQANITRMQSLAAKHGRRLRPHAKTHKLPAIAKMQIEAGATGICCAKLGEAEVFAEAGIKDIRLPYPVHPSKAARVVALLNKVTLSIIVDHPRIAREWSEAMTAAGRVLPVLVKVDVGFHRCGVNPDSPEALDLIEEVSTLPGLKMLGLLSHAGHAYHAANEDALRQVAREEAETMTGLAERAQARGVPIGEISVGATPPARFSMAEPGITELRPGNYVYNDRTQVGLGAARLDDCALTVLATVVSKPDADRIVLDSGTKTLSSDGARGFESTLAGQGAIFTTLDQIQLDTELLIERLSEEHATVRVTSGQTKLEPGDRVRILPNHSCVVSNLVDEVHFTDGGNGIIETVRVAARGKIV
jgi:D-serine deaminase-like pyridoxal phosphate-dependent protein